MNLLSIPSFEVHNINSLLNSMNYHISQQEYIRHLMFVQSNNQSTELGLVLNKGKDG